MSDTPIARITGCVSSLRIYFVGRRLYVRTVYVPRLLQDGKTSVGWGRTSTSYDDGGAVSIEGGYLWIHASARAPLFHEDEG